MVFLRAPRQTGKTTLVRSLSATGGPRRDLTLDDTVVLARRGSHDPMASATGDRFVGGMVLCLGDVGLPSVIACTAVPLSALWEW